MNNAHRRRIDQLDHDEQDRQDRKWGPDRHHPNGTGPDVAALAEIGLDPFRATAQELAEAATAATDRRATNGMLDWADILLEEVFEALAEEGPRELRHELVQARAVIAQWIADLDRQLGDAPADDRRRFSAAHVRVYVVIAGHQDNTDSQLHRRYQALALQRDWPMLSASGIRSRRAELVRWGLVEKADRVGQTENGRKASTWSVRPLEQIDYAAAQQLLPAVDWEPVKAALAAATVYAGEDVIATSHLAVLRRYVELGDRA